MSGKKSEAQIAINIKQPKKLRLSKETQFEINSSHPIKNGEDTYMEETKRDDKRSGEIGQQSSSQE